MKKKAKGKSIYKKQDNIAGYVMLAPWMFGFLLMWFIPMLISIYYSFTNFNLLNDAKVIGFDNYIRIFTQDETFRQALKVTFIYVLFLVPLRLAFALLVAMLLNKKHKCLGLYRTIYYIPSIIGGSIAVSIVITLSIWHKPEGIIPWKPTYSTWSNHTYGCMAVWIINAYFPCSLKADSGFTL